jgi:hypothetical protein
MTGNDVAAFLERTGLTRREVGDVISVDAVTIWRWVCYKDREIHLRHHAELIFHHLLAKEEKVSAETFKRWIGDLRCTRISQGPLAALSHLLHGVWKP